MVTLTGQVKKLGRLARLGDVARSCPAAEQNAGMEAPKSFTIDFDFPVFFLIACFIENVLLNLFY